MSAAKCTHTHAEIEREREREYVHECDDYCKHSAICLSVNTRSTKQWSVFSEDEGTIARAEENVSTSQDKHRDLTNHYIHRGATQCWRRHFYRSYELTVNLLYCCYRCGWFGFVIVSIHYQTAWTSVTARVNYLVVVLTFTVMNVFRTQMGRRWGLTRARKYTMTWSLKAPDPHYECVGLSHVSLDKVTLIVSVICRQLISRWCVFKCSFFQVWCWWVWLNDWQLLWEN